MAAGTRRGPRAEKRRAILAGACTAFANQGYSRASIDAIAAGAGVSTRTIYNHFGTKAELFETVLRHSTAEVADAQIEIIHRHLTAVSDLERDLTRFGRELTMPMTRFAEHFALIRQIDAEGGNVPAAALEAWREAGPQRVTGVLAEHMKELADRKLLKIGEPERAATHFMLLTQGAIPFQHGLTATREADVDDIVTSGVHVFLHGYLA